MKRSRSGGAVPVSRSKSGVLLTIALLVIAAALPASAAAQLPNPLFTWAGAADPGMAHFGGRYYAVSTGDDGGGTGRIKSSPDRRTWSRSGYIFPKGTAPEWISVDNDGRRRVGGPQIYFLPSINKYVAYFSARSAKTEKRCIGRAESSNPYDFTNVGLGANPAVSPLECRDDATYSLIDASLFYDPRGNQLYLLYKRDYDDGGPTQDDIVIRRVDPDGRSNPGPPTQLVVAERGTWEGFSVEAPTMIFRNGRYYLFYSGANYARDTYAVGVAVSSIESNRPDSKLVKYDANPILRGEGDNEFCGVGHQDVTNVGGDGWLLFYHAYLGGLEADGDCVGTERFLMMDVLRWDQPGGSPRVGDFWPSVNDRTPSGNGMGGSPEGAPFPPVPVGGPPPGPPPGPPSGTPPGPTPPPSAAGLSVRSVRLSGGRTLRFRLRSAVAGTARVSVLRGRRTVARSSRGIRITERRRSLSLRLNRRLARGRYTVRLVVTNGGRRVGSTSVRLRVRR
jgi:hypothetical protein